MRDRRRIERVGGLVVDSISASSRGLGRSMDSPKGAVRYESVYARKRRSSPAVKARVQKGTDSRILLSLCICLADSGFGLVLGWVFKLVL